MTASYTRVWLVCLLGILLASCGSSRDSAGTVDDAVTLLQDLNARNVWETVADRLVTLNDQTSYRAAISLQSGALSASDGAADASGTDLALEIEVDDQTNARVTITENGTVTTYYIAGYAGDSEHMRIYRAGEGELVCITAGEHVSILRGGLQGIFDLYRLEAIGMQTLAVVDRTDNEQAVVAERAAIEYRLESRVNDALAIAAELGNSDGQAAIHQAGQFELRGDLYLDEATLALLRVSSFYTDLAAEQSYRLVFVVTQWGGIEPIVELADTETAGECGF